MKYITSTKKYLFALLLTLLAFFGATAPLYAQDNPDESQSSEDEKPKPVRIGFVNSAGDDGTSVYDTIDGFFTRSPDIERVDPEMVMKEANKLNLSRDDFRSGDTRINRSEDFKKLIHKLRLESLFILDVYGRGRKAQIVALGPDGLEVTDKRANIRNSSITDNQAGSLIRDVFGDVVPAVKLFREQGGYPPVVVEKTKPVRTLEEEPAAVLEKPKEVEESVAWGDTRYLTFAVYPYFGLNSTKLKDAQNVEVNFSSSYFGGALSLDSRFLNITNSIALGVSLYGGFSPFKTKDQAGETASSYFAFGQLQFNLHFEVIPHLTLSPFVGGDFYQLKIEETPTLEYLGATFIGARAGLLTSYQIQDFSAGLSLGVLPSFVSEISKKQYGSPKSKVVLSYEGRLILSYRVATFIEIIGGYDFRFSAAPLDKPGRFFSEPPDFQVMNHGATLGVGLRL